MLGAALPLLLDGGTDEQTAPWAAAWLRTNPPLFDPRWLPAEFARLRAYLGAGARGSPAVGHWSGSGHAAQAGASHRHVSCPSRLSAMWKPRKSSPVQRGIAPVTAALPARWSAPRRTTPVRSSTRSTWVSTIITGRASVLAFSVEASSAVPA